MNQDALRVYIDGPSGRAVYVFWRGQFVDAIAAVNLDVPRKVHFYKWWPPRVAQLILIQEGEP